VVSTPGSGEGAGPSEGGGDDPTPFIALGVAGGVVVVGAIIVGVVLSLPPPSGPEPFVGNVGMGAWVIP
jgi:hypothetical protein